MKQYCIKRIFVMLVFIFTFFIYTKENALLAEAADSTYELGDANSDSSVDVNDIVRLKRIMQGIADATSNSYIAGNESVGDVDLTILRQIIVCDKGSTSVKTAFFIDNEGNLAKMHTVPINGSAVPPMMPKREGYYPGGWSADYHQISESTVLRPAYISNTANNIFLLDSATVSEGEAVSLKVNLCGTVKLINFQVRLEYNPEVLEVVSYGDDNETVIINHIPAKNKILMNFSRATNRTKALELTQVTFKVKDGVQLDGTEVRLVVESAYYVESNGDYAPAKYEEISGLLYAE